MFTEKVRIIQGEQYNIQIVSSKREVRVRAYLGADGAAIEEALWPYFQHRLISEFTVKARATFDIFKRIYKAMVMGYATIK